MKITINKKKYNVKFGYGAIRKIVELYGYKKPSDFDKIIKKYNLEDLSDPSFEQIDFLGNLLRCGILNAHPNFDLPVDDILDVLMSDATMQEEMLKEFADSQIQQKPNPETRGKQ